MASKARNPLAFGLSHALTLSMDYYLQTPIHLPKSTWNLSGQKWVLRLYTLKKIEDVDRIVLEGLWCWFMLAHSGVFTVCCGYVVLLSLIVSQQLEVCSVSMDNDLLLMLKDIS